MTTILLVEDDESLSNTLRSRLGKEGYEVLCARSCAEAQRLIEATRFDLAILDVNLPDGDGFSVARAIRAREAREVPFLFLTAMSSAEFRLEGYEIGASDFVPKPFHLRELLLRLKRVLGNHAGATPFRSGGIEFDPRSFSVSLPDGRKVFLQKRDFDLLAFLVQSSPGASSREEILRTAWRSSPTSNFRTIDNSIVRLRNTLGDPFRTWIRSVRGVGYQWLPN